MPVKIHDRVVYGADDLVIRWVQDRIKDYQRRDGSTALGILDAQGHAVAGVVYEGRNPNHVEASIAADPGARWASRPVLRRIFGYPFNQLGVKAITVLVPATNVASLKLATGLGFECEALVKYAAPDGSHMIVLKMYRDTCRWLDHEQRKQRACTSRPGSNGTRRISI